MDSGERSFPGLVASCCGTPLPEKAHLAGYAALIEGCELTVPTPRTLCAIGSGSRVTTKDKWRLLAANHRPDATLEGHLTFALKHEGVDLAVLKSLFRTVAPREVRELVLSKPNGAYARRIWFLYEWLMGEELNFSIDAKRTYVPVVDSRMQLSVEGKNSKRHGVRNNLPGTPDFCPMVFRTPAIEEGLGLNLGQRAREIVDRTPRDLLNRAAAFLILKDSRSSFEIEGERVSTDRVRRWGQVIGEAGGTPLGIEEFVRLQKLLLGDTKLVPIGLRKDGVFVGEHDRFDRTPIPDHIGARPEDLLDLMGGLVAFDQGFAQLLDPVVAAAVLAFGFVYIHPLADGNGRLHRYLIHHTLARQGFNPPGIVFPISSVILDRIAGYRIALEDYSKRLLRCIEWNPTGEGNLEVLNDTSDFYRYFDATPHVEFLFSCVRRAVEHDLPAETNFLRRYDALRSGVENLVEMPKSTFNLLFKFLEQNEGRLSKRALEQEFAALSKDEVTEIEAMYREIFEIEEDARPRFDP